MIQRDLTRWPGRPTSGRYVFRARCGQGFDWYWQCDLCYSDGAEYPTKWVDALKGAIDHARACDQVCKNNRSFK